MRCSKCGAKNSDDAKYCSECGQKIVKAEYLCPKCHQPLYDKPKFCDKCGKELIWDEAVCSKIPIPINGDKKIKKQLGFKEAKNPMLIVGQVINFIFFLYSIVCFALFIQSWSCFPLAILILVSLVAIIATFSALNSLSNDEKVSKNISVLIIVLGFFQIINVFSIVAGFKLLKMNKTSTEEEKVDLHNQEKENDDVIVAPDKAITETHVQQQSNSLPTEEPEKEEVQAEVKQEKKQPPTKTGSRLSGFVSKITSAVKETFKEINSTSTNNGQPNQTATNDEPDDCEGKPLDWFVDSKNKNVINQYLGKENYIIDDEIREKMKEEFKDEYSILDNSFAGFENIWSSTYEEYKLPTVLFNSYLTSFFESIHADEIISDTVIYYLVGLFKSHNCPYFLDESGDFVDRASLPAHILFDKSQNPYLKYLNLFMENIGKDLDPKSVSLELSTLVIECLTFIYKGIMNLNAEVVEENPWLYNRNTYFVIGNKLRTNEQFKNKCKSLAKNPEYLFDDSSC